MLLAGAIFVLTLVLVIWQPRGLGIGWSAAFGAALALVTGGVQKPISRWCGISSGMPPPRLSP
ncbi:Arsenic efflux pump protein [Klebsiella quasipneumoniae]|nr:Arsenic efflux pump protein [Klebsiella quasipneumoniae]